MVQLSHLYTTTRKIIALTIQTFVGKVTCLLFNMLSSSSKEQASFNFMAAVTICSDFGIQENIALEKEISTHSSILDWRLPGTGEPGGLLSMESHRVGHN